MLLGNVSTNLKFENEFWVAGKRVQNSQASIYLVITTMSFEKKKKEGIKLIGHWGDEKAEKVYHERSKLLNATINLRKMWV